MTLTPRDNPTNSVLLIFAFQIYIDGFEVHIK